MRVFITARSWGDDLKAKFGDELTTLTTTVPYHVGAFADIPDDTATAFRELAPFGRFEIIDDGEVVVLEFQNDYD